MPLLEAPDGKTFSDRGEYRKYLFLTQYTFRDREDDTLKKNSGEISGQPFDLTSLRRCEVLLLDHSEAVQVDDVTESRVFIAACADSVFVRNCSDCVFTVACKQLRTRDCTDCEFRLYCKTEPIIETSTRLAFGPFNGAYVGHERHLEEAGLTTPNLWFGVYDFNDDAKTGHNWRLLDAGGADETWRPLDDDAHLAVPLTLPGTVPLPSKKIGGFGGMSGGRSAIGSDASGGGNAVAAEGSMSFSILTSASEAEAAINDSLSFVGNNQNGDGATGDACGNSDVMTPGANEGQCRGNKGREEDKPSVEAAAGTGVGWNHSRLLGPTPLASARVSSANGGGGSGSGIKPTSGADPVRQKIGWDPSRLNRTNTTTANAASYVATARQRHKETPNLKDAEDAAERLARAAPSGGSKAVEKAAGSERDESPRVANTVGWNASRASAAKSSQGHHAATPAAMTTSITPNVACASEALYSSPLSPEAAERWSDTPVDAHFDQTVFSTHGGGREGQGSAARPLSPAESEQEEDEHGNRGGDEETPQTQSRQHKEDTGRSRVTQNAVRASINSSTTIDNGCGTDKAGVRIGWDATRIGDPSFPAGVKHSATSSEFASHSCATVEGNKTTTRVARRREQARLSGVPVQLRAVLLYASTQRGIDLRKWFDLRGGDLEEDGDSNEEGPPVNLEQAEECRRRRSTTMTTVQFELVLAGLAEGLKAGLSEEEREEIEAAVAPAVVAAAARAASLPPEPIHSPGDGERNLTAMPAGATDATAKTIATNANADTISIPAPDHASSCKDIAPERPAKASAEPNATTMVDVGELLRLCGISCSEQSPKTCKEESDERRCEATASTTSRVKSPRKKRPQNWRREKEGQEMVRQSGNRPEGGRARTAWGTEDDGLENGGEREDIHRWVGKGVREDEDALRRVIHQADLYNRLLAILGLRPPSGASSGGGHAAWEASLKASSITLDDFCNALREVGLPLSTVQTFALAARAGRRVGLRCASFSSTVSTDTAPESSVAQRQKLCRRKTVGTRSSTNVDLDRDDGATSTRGKRTDVSAWALRTYLLKLRVAPRSHEAGEQRPERFSYLSGGGSAPHSSGNDEGRKVREGHRAPSGGEREGGDHVGGVGRPADFATWGRRVRKDRAWKDKDRKREFQKALAGHAHTLSREELEEFVRKFEILPKEVIARELQAMSKAFSESVEGRRRAREIVERWNQASPASRNIATPDDPSQSEWESAQALSGSDRRSRARAIVMKERKEELARSEATSASVSRGLFLAYVRNVGGGDGGRSLMHWLEERQAAIKKARELEAGRERAQALSKADTQGRQARAESVICDIERLYALSQALVSEVKEELIRLVGFTKKAQKVANAPGMEILRSSREGLDLHRRLKRLEKAAEEEGRKREGDLKAKKLESPHHRKRKGEQHAASNAGQALLSKEAFNAEMGDTLFSLIAEGGDVAARARELAGVPMIAPDLRKRWAEEMPGSARDGIARSPGETPPSREDVEHPCAEGLFTVEAELLLRRGRKEAQQKRELALQKYREWCKEKEKEARRFKRQQRADQEQIAELEGRKRSNGLKAYRRWVKLAAKDKYFSAQTHRVVPRASPSSKAGSRASDSQGSTSSSDTVSGRILLGTRRECGPPQRQDDEDGEDGVRGLSRLLADHQRGPWDSSTYGAEAIYSGDVTGVVPEDAFPAFL